MRDRIPLKSAALAHWNGFPCQKRFIAFEPLGPQHQRVRRDPVPFIKNEDVALNNLAARHPHGPAITHDTRTRRGTHESEARRVGNAGGSTCRSQWSTSTYNNK